MKRPGTAAVRRQINEVNDENNYDPNRFVPRKPAVPKTVRPMTANVK
jgi:hypothetical protein